jgi:hypothetical protein
MPKDIERRLAALERRGGGSGWTACGSALSDEELIAELGAVYGFDPAGVSKTPAEAAAKGFASIDLELAAAAGIPYAEWRQEALDASREYEAAHEFLWGPGGKVYVRPSRGGEW